MCVCCLSLSLERKGREGEENRRIVGAKMVRLRRGNTVRKLDADKETEAVNGDDSRGYPPPASSAPPAAPPAPAAAAAAEEDSELAETCLFTPLPSSTSHSHLPSLAGTSLPTPPPPVSTSSKHREKLPHLAGLIKVVSPLLNDAAGAIVEDTFWRCFQLSRPQPWNWNWYLFPLWCVGVVIRYCILFPIRLCLLLLGFVAFAISFTACGLVVRDDEKRKACQRQLAVFLCSVFVASWTGVIRYHGPLPSARRNQIFVANHTSMIDFIVLEQIFSFAVIMQAHKGWVGFMQSKVLVPALNCIQFNRTESKDRHTVAGRIKEHVTSSRTLSNPLLVFPEGVCVNNEYCVRFKKGAFDLGDDVTVRPVAIKYNKIFVDAHWNSRKYSFSQHLFTLMTSWAVVCDVHFLEPCMIREGEDAVEFAERVRRLICSTAGLKMVQWDGYLKYMAPSEKLAQEQRKNQATRLKDLLRA